MGGFNPGDILSELTAVKLRHEPETLDKDTLQKLAKYVDKKRMCQRIAKMGPPFNHNEVRLLHENMDDPFPHDESYMDQWSDDVIQKYADHVRNYYFNYKPEATGIDPSIDPGEEQLGPMAQDLEKVNPAVVKEHNGVKTVDTNKLALMNAGAIADLARRINGKSSRD
jgi:hypothetical protein